VSQGDPTPSLAVTPAEPMLDEPIGITASGLDPDEQVTLEVEMEWGETTFTAEATYEADADGVVDPAETAPETGPYEDVDRMGPFWAMTPTPESPNTLEPIPARLLTTIRLRRAGDVAATAEIVRRSRPTGVSRRSIDAGGLPSDLYLPPGEGPHPGVVVLGGSEGGKPDRTMPWLLASRGYAVLGPAYFGAEGSPAAALSEVPVEAVEAAVDWFGERERVQRAPLAVIGRSRGSELAFLLAGRMDRVRCVIGIVPSGVATEGLTARWRPAGTGAWQLAGTPHAYVPLSLSLRERASLGWSTVKGDPLELRGTYTDAIEGADPETVADAELPVQLTGGPVCLLAGEDDRLWDGATFARRIRDRLSDAGYDYAVDCRTYAGAGHALSVPYLPTTDRDTVGKGRMQLSLGGTPRGYAAADEDAWRAILSTLGAIGEPTGAE
jgi:dienelactone hydrolase